MTGRTRLTVVAVAGVVVMSGLWLTSGAFTRRAPAAATSGAVRVMAGSLDDLLMDLQVVPMDGQAAKPFSLEGLDGKRVTLADLAGRPALLYFWAMW